MHGFVTKSQDWPATSRLIAVAGLVLAPRVLVADPAPNITAGQKLAQQHCAQCHVVVPSGKRGWTNAPAFEAIANRAGITEQTLATFIERPHMHMENSGRPPAEANEIAVYILSLRKN
jgi:cytochrome c